ncbi:MAG: serine/threonine-protein phosphatase [Atopobiaceae bacterium]|nr:serine/threonine-protein phosphatase [Atopobiaceae bacterium]
MAYVAACTDKGSKRRTNQDACCIQVANTAFGEVLMAVVCDGVGGLQAGELASATVAYRFAQWFTDELPTLLQNMDVTRPLNFDMVETVWGVLLNNLNEVIQNYGREHHGKLGTTFTGMLVSEGRYIVGHVGDCRLYQIAPRGVRQVTVDQTLLNKMLASGELKPEEAKNFKQGHVILQSVGTEGLLRPVFYRGTCTPNDLFVLACDGAYRKAEDVGVASFFQGVNHHDEDALNRACREMLQYDLAHGETDNLTVVCVSAELESRGQVASQLASQAVAGPAARAQELGADAARVARDVDVDDDPITMLHDEEPDGDDAPTMVEPDDAPTMLDPQDDDALTMVEPDDDAPTMLEPDDADLPTRVERDES